MAADVGAVVVTHGAGNDYGDLVDALLREGFPPSAVTVVHAAGPSAVLSNGVEIIGTLVDRGFPQAANVGIRQQLARGVDYLLLLPHDVRFQEGALRTLVDGAGRHPEFGIFGPVVWWREKEQPFSYGGVLDANGHPIRSVVPLAAEAEIAEATWVDGAAMLIRRETWAAAGPLSERLFLYFFELDLSLRAAALGHRTGVVMGARVSHSPGAGSSGAFVFHLTRDELEYALSSGGVRQVVREAKHQTANLFGFCRMIAGRRSTVGVRREYVKRAAALLTGAASFALRRHGPAPRWLSR